MTARAFILASICILALYSSPVQAGCKWADAVMRNGHYKMAYAQYSLCEAQEDPYAIYQIGGMYLKGLGLKQDGNMASRYFFRAAHKNFHPAQARVGLMFWRGDLVVKNLARAYQWLILAADDGDEEYVRYRDMLKSRLTGADVRDGRLRVFKWRLEKAHDGMVEMQRRVGIVYWKGEDVKPDAAEAYKWFQVAIDNGDKESVRLMQELTKKMSMEELERGRSLVKKWKEDHKKAQTFTVPGS